MKESGVFKTSLFSFACESLLLYQGKQGLISISTWPPCPRVRMFPILSQLLNVHLHLFAIPGSIYGAQCSMKMCCPFSEMTKNFQGVDIRALNQAWGPSELGALCDCTTPGPTEPDLSERWGSTSRTQLVRGSPGFSASPRTALSWILLSPVLHLQVPLFPPSHPPRLMEAWLSPWFPWLKKNSKRQSRTVRLGHYTNPVLFPSALWRVLKWKLKRGLGVAPCLAFPIQLTWQVNIFETMILISSAVWKSLGAGRIFRLAYFRKWYLHSNLRGLDFQRLQRAQPM